MTDVIFILLVRQKGESGKFAGVSVFFNGGQRGPKGITIGYPS